MQFSAHVLPPFHEYCTDNVYQLYSNLLLHICVHACHILYVYGGVHIRQCSYQPSGALSALTIRHGKHIQVRFSLPFETHC
jgi:hypothetical protein